MPLINLDITDFRNISSAKLELIPQGFNFLYGNNGSGKTSLLEAVYYLSRGRSFRSSTIHHIVKNSADKFAIFAQLHAKNSQSIPIGVERARAGDLRIRMLGKDESSFAELVKLTPTLLINSASFNLLDAGPVFRRKYLDWGAFYVINDFLRIWKHYERALKQRNAALRARVSKHELMSWTAELVQYGMQLDQLRREFIDYLMPFLNNALEKLLVIPGLRIHYQPGWDENLSLEDALNKAMDKDRYAGFTQSGPHRADFKMMINSAPAKDILSRGQQKLFICAMIVAQGALLNQRVDKKPIYLIDDLPSELDSISRGNLMTLLSSQEAQIFVTAVERSALTDLIARDSTRMFHVEHGNVTI